MNPKSRRLCGKDLATEQAWTGHGTTHRGRTFSLPRVYARQMGAIARRYADDTHAGRGHPAAFPARSARHAGGGGVLSAAVALVFPLRDPHPPTVARPTRVPRH